MHYAQPTVNIGRDTSICSGSSLTLNAGNAGATYLWSTGATTQTISVNSSGIYWVDVTNVSGTTRDSINVTVLQPSNFSANDTTICSGNRTISLQNADPSQYLYSWWDAPTGGNRVATGATLIQNFSAGSFNYFVESINYANVESAGFPNNSNGGSFTTAGGLGLNFNALKDIIIDSITIYTNGPLGINIELRNAANKNNNCNIIF